MTDSDLDARLAALLADPSVPAKDERFAERVIALAGQEMALRRRRRSAIHRVGLETLAFLAVLGAFTFLARVAPDAAGPGDSIALGSPAMAGLLVLLMWGMTTVAPARR